MTGRYSVETDYQLLPSYEKTEISRMAAQYRKRTEELVGISQIQHLSFMFHTISAWKYHWAFHKCPTWHFSDVKISPYKTRQHFNDCGEKRAKFHTRKAVTTDDI